MKPEKEMIQQGEYGFVNVLKNKHGEAKYKIYANELVTFWNGFLKNSEKLPPGSWEIIGMAKDLGESECMGIVGEYSGLYEYPNFEIGGFPMFAKAIPSFFSLLKSKGLNPVCCLIIKNVK